MRSNDCTEQRSLIQFSRVFLQRKTSQAFVLPDMKLSVCQTLSLIDTINFKQSNLYGRRSGRKLIKELDKKKPLKKQQLYPEATKRNSERTMPNNVLS